MTPQWDKSWGENYKSKKRLLLLNLDFISKSTELHDAMPILVDTPFYRLTCTYDTVM